MSVPQDKHLMIMQLHLISKSAELDDDVIETDENKLSFNAAVAPKYLPMHRNDIHESDFN